MISPGVPQIDIRFSAPSPSAGLLSQPSHAALHSPGPETPRFLPSDPLATVCPDPPGQGRQLPAARGSVARSPAACSRSVWTPTTGPENVLCALPQSSGQPADGFQTAWESLRPTSSDAKHLAVSPKSSSFSPDSSQMSLSKSFQDR